MRQALNDKQIEADRWGDLGQLNHDHEEDPEPDRIKSGGDDQWQCDRQAHHSDGDAFKEHAQNNVKHRQGAVRPISAALSANSLTIILGNMDFGHPAFSASPSEVKNLIQSCCSMVRASSEFFSAIVETFR